MAQNPYDQVSRYAAKLDPFGLLGWLYRDASLFDFLGWLDARTVPFPHDPERICDTVAALRERATGALWAVPVEFNLTPDHLLFGRLLVYLGLLWQEVRPTDGPATRYHVGACAMNLTGHGQTAQDMQLGEMRTLLKPVERDLADGDAATVLQGIAAGSVTRCLLPWIPLMRGGDNSATLEQWQALAGAEADAQRRADYGGLALIFAEAAGRFELWSEALRRWNMIESQVVNRWKAEGKAEGAATMLVQLLRKKFRVEPPADLVAAIAACQDPRQLAQWQDAALDAATLEDFRRVVESAHRNGA
ncbi:MAG: hypothetical protein JNM56_06435 [Planctomycetia bacterium]|nr:hypothetical protein [Planctomycetia bacterium]